MVEDQGRLIENNVWTCQGHAEHVRALLSDVTLWMAGQCIDVDNSQNMELVLAEVLNNIVEHAYSDTDGDITVSLSLHNGFLQADCLDHGKAMPHGPPSSAKGFDPNMALNDLPEGGFGWGLIRSLCSGASYQRIGTQNRTTLILDLGLRNNPAE